MEASVPRPARTPPGHVRPLERSDLERVAHLFLDTFRRRGQRAGDRAAEDVAAYMERLYLQGPFGEDGINALVHVGRDGAIGGFLGLLKTRYGLDGEPLTACIISTLMADDDGRAAPQLLRGLNSAGFDLQLTDSANRASLAFARPLKYELMLFDSLRWICAFKPTTMLVDRMRQRWPRQPLQLMMPLASATDALIGRALKTPAKRHRTTRLRSETIDAAGFAAIAPSFLSAFRLRPLWPADELRWLLDHAAEKRAGGALCFVRVVDREGKPVGCYAFHGEAGKVATVLHAFAAEPHWPMVLDDLMNTAEEMGCSGVAGQAHQAMMPHLYRYPGLIFQYAGGTMVRSARKDVMAAVRGNDVFIGGLVGDRWTRLSADEFGMRDRRSEAGQAGAH
jgi:hypothetical protein